MGLNFLNSKLLLGLLLLVVQLQPTVANWFCNNQCYSCPSILRQCSGHVDLKRVCHDARKYPRTQRPPCTTTDIQYHKVTKYGACTRTRTATHWSPIKVVTQHPCVPTTKTVVVATHTVQATKETVSVSTASTTITITDTITIAESPTPLPKRAIATIEERYALDDATLSAACYCYWNLAPKKTVRHYQAKTTTYYRDSKTLYHTKTLCKPSTRTVPCHSTVVKDITTTITHTNTVREVSTTTTTITSTSLITTTIFPAPDPTHCPSSDTVTAPELGENQLWSYSVLYAGAGFLTRFFSPDGPVGPLHESVTGQSVCEAVFNCALLAAKGRWLSWALTRYYGTRNDEWSCDGFVNAQNMPVNFTDTSAWNIPSNRVREAYHYVQTGLHDPSFGLFGVNCSLIPTPGRIYHLDRWIPGYTLPDDNPANPPGSPAPIQTVIPTDNGCDAVDACAAFARSGSSMAVYKSFNVYWQYSRGVWICRAFFGLSPGFDAYTVFNYDAVVSFGFATFADGS
ncbi:hypothetical protein TWF696_003268 [Orbilia brochopaga]|uniref:Uncharacterized protein n=1 Tax=Orbilia brochopaga TaxID=3140254 RepID=A0AAV9TY27_9PEZI